MHTLHYIALRYSTVQHITLQYGIVHYFALQYSTLHYTTLYYIALVQYLTLHYSTAHDITLHEILHNIHTHVFVQVVCVCICIYMCVFVKADRKHLPGHQNHGESLLVELLLEALWALCYVLLGADTCECLETYIQETRAQGCQKASIMPIGLLVMA